MDNGRVKEKIQSEQVGVVSKWIKGTHLKYVECPWINVILVINTRQKLE